jgi:hypothetical protein
MKNLFNDTDVPMYFLPGSDKHDGRILRDVKQYLQSRLPVGASCPCCGQFAKIYRRKFNSAMATTIRECAENFAMNPIPFHAPTVLKLRGKGRDRDMAFLEDWGLVRAVEGKGIGGRTAGMYEVTQDGISFVANQKEVPRYLFFYNAGVIGKSKETIRFQDAKIDRFNVAEVMSPARPPKGRV